MDGWAANLPCMTKGQEKTELLLLLQAVRDRAEKLAVFFYSFAWQGGKGAAGVSMVMFVCVWMFCMGRAANGEVEGGRPAWRLQWHEEGSQITRWMKTVVKLDAVQLVSGDGLLGTRWEERLSCSLEVNNTQVAELHANIKSTVGVWNVSPFR